MTFTIEKNGVPQRIEQFQLVELTGHQEAGDDLSLEIRSRHHGNTEVARDDVRIFLVCWDEYHIPQFQSADIVRAALDSIRW